MRWGVYDLRFSPPSFDFLTFLLLAKYHGAEGILFIPGICERKTGQYDAKAQAKRIRTILLPACALYGMPWKATSFEAAREVDVAWPAYFRSTGGQLICAYTMGWLRSIREPEPFMPTPEALSRVEHLRGRIIVHMRTMGYQLSRNTGPDWERWAKDRNAHIVPDDEISLDVRLALHEVAGLNMGVSCGTMVLSEYSEHRPYVILKRLAGEFSSNKEFFAMQGWKIGDQVPWAGKHQVAIWNDKDDYETIESAYQGWLANNPKELARCQESRGCTNAHPHPLPTPNPSEPASGPGE